MNQGMGTKDSALELLTAIARVQERLRNLKFRFERDEHTLKAEVHHTLRYVENNGHVGPYLTQSFSASDLEQSYVEWDTALFHDGKWQYTFDCYISHSTWREQITAYFLPTLETDDLAAIIAALDECPKLIEDSLNSKPFADWFEGVPAP